MRGRTPGQRKEATLKVGVMMTLPAVLRDLGANPAVLLREAGFSPDLLKSPDNVMSFAARGRLLAHCVERTGCEHLGLLVGARAGLNSLGLVGLLARQSNTVELAWRSIVRHLHLHTNGASTALIDHGQFALLVFDIHQASARANDQVADGALAVIVNVMRDLCGAHWNPAEIMLAHHKPADMRPFREFFRAPVLFDAERNAIAFHSDWLHRELPPGDEELRRLIDEKIDVLEAQHGEAFPDQVRSVLRTALLTGHAGIERVAALFSLHPRTLHRRLQAFEVTFTQLVDECRYSIARQLLEDSMLAVAKVAEILDYADASAFTRAFRRWSDTTPAQWRRNLSPRLRRPV